MDDDRNMRDRMAGPPRLDGQAGDDPRAGSSGTAPGGDERAEGAGPAGGEQAAGEQSPPEEQSPSEKQPPPEKGARKRRSFWFELLTLVVGALVIALLVKTFVVQAFYIPSSSMENTLLPGDKVLVNKIVYHLRPIQPGDIVVFDGAGSWDPVAPAAKHSSDPIVTAYRATLDPLFRAIGGLFGTAPGQTDYIKRVIGVPGDHVACCNAQGLVTVNGKALHEQSYLYPGAAPSEIHFNIVVPRGRLWVMGDNRLVSDDSRLHTSDPGAGTIPEKMVIGRASLIVWPVHRWRVLQIPATFGQPGISKAAAAAAALAAPGGSAAPVLPLAGGVAVALPITWLERRVRLRRRRTRRR